ncbi:MULTISPECIES: sarcosine oxidase subunit gamma family protein [Sphingomonas]|uniref:sarcosine oxidase subunit gamma family protein n=1 Tax=Sphingomonas TaxID=13687 RepID=UPI0015EC3440|nr:MULTISPECIES: sarcosine oxidase subunit gamma family protein [Sphingomonas]MBA2921013.1 hypothetical protein [Sphingomonas sp. CGMCC 1.13658]
MDVRQVDAPALWLLRVFRPTPENVSELAATLDVAVAERAGFWVGGASPNLRIGPGEWIFRDALPEALSEAREKLKLHSLTPLGAAMSAWRIDATHAPALLASGTEVDLHPRAFLAGAGVKTLFARIPVLISNRGANGFELLHDSAWLAYVSEWLAEARRSFDIAESA